MILERICIFIGLALAFVPELFAQSPPSNDNFADAIVLTGSSISASGTLLGATYETAESTVPDPIQASGGSVWWTWTAPKSSTVVIIVRRDNPAINHVNAYLQIYSGADMTNLTLLDGTSFDNPSGR